MFGDCFWVCGTLSCLAGQHVGCSGKEGGPQGQDGAIGRETSVSFLPNFVSPKVSRGCLHIGPVQYCRGCLGLHSHSHVNVDMVLLPCYYTGFGHWVFGTAVEDKSYGPLFMPSSLQSLCLTCWLAQCKSVGYSEQSGLCSGQWLLYPSTVRGQLSKIIFIISYDVLMFYDICDIFLHPVTPTPLLGVAWCCLALLVCSLHFPLNYMQVAWLSETTDHCKVDGYEM